MNQLESQYDYNNLITILNQLYPINVQEIRLYRTMIGHVYYLKANRKKYVLKIYRSFHKEHALQSIEIINYLKENQYPVVTIIPTKNNEFYIPLALPDGESIAILYDFIKGVEPDFNATLASVGQQIGKLHNIMEHYPHSLIRRGKEFYIERFISMLKDLEYDAQKINDLKEYGDELWAQMEKLPKGFCHGDLHSGNMFQTKRNDFILFDFDIASNSHSMIDVATLCDGTHFNHFDENSFNKTKQKFNLFYQGYSKERTLSSEEIEAIFDFIAIRHYELIATITECEGLKSLHVNFLDQQYDWLMNWRSLCKRKRIDKGEDE